MKPLHVWILGRSCGLLRDVQCARLLSRSLGMCACRGTSAAGAAAAGFPAPFRRIQDAGVQWRACHRRVFSVTASVLCQQVYIRTDLD